MEKKPYPSETQERFIVRFPDGMRDRIAEAAKSSSRSMNSEIILRLEESFSRTHTSHVDLSRDSNMLQQLADERKKTSDVLGIVSTTLAKMVTKLTGILTKEQKELSPEVGVFDMFAKGVTNGHGAAIVESLDLLNKPSEQHKTFTEQKK